GREMLREVRVVVRVALDVFLDRDARVGLLELLVQVVVAEVAEQVDAKRHVSMTRRGRGARKERARSHECDHEDRRGRSTGPPRSPGSHRTLPSFFPIWELAPSPRAFA